MRPLEINLKTLYFVKVNGEEMEKDEDGFFTGARVKAYGDVQRVRGRLAPLSEDQTVNQLSIRTNDNLRFLTYDLSTSLDEESLVWVWAEQGDLLYVSESKVFDTVRGRYLSTDELTEVSLADADRYNFTVEKTARDQNAITFYLREVDRQ